VSLREELARRLAGKEVWWSLMPVTRERIHLVDFDQLSQDHQDQWLRLADEVLRQMEFARQVLGGQGAIWDEPLRLAPPGWQP
jgi:hypothetical protein